MSDIDDKEKESSLPQEAAILGKLLEEKIIRGEVSLADARKLLGLVDVASVPNMTETGAAVKTLLESKDKKEEAEVLADIKKEAALSLHAHMSAYGGCGHHQIDDGRIVNRSIAIGLGFGSFSLHDTSALYINEYAFGYKLEHISKIAIGKATIHRRDGNHNYHEVSSYKDVVSGSTNQEPIYFMAAKLASFARKGDSRPAIMDLFLLLPKSVAERLYTCLHRNPAFIYEVCRDLICDRFPDFKEGWDEHEKIGIPRKEKSIIIMGPSDIETLMGKYKTAETHRKPEKAEFEKFAHEIK